MPRRPPRSTPRPSAGPPASAKEGAAAVIKAAVSHGRYVTFQMAEVAVPRQTTTAKVRLEAGKAECFSASAQSTDWFDSCCARGARFTVAHDGRRGDPWP